MTAIPWTKRQIAGWGLIRTLHKANYLIKDTAQVSPTTLSIIKEEAN